MGRHGVAPAFVVLYVHTVFDALQALTRGAMHRLGSAIKRPHTDAVQDPTLSRRRGTAGRDQAPAAWQTRHEATSATAWRAAGVRALPARPRARPPLHHRGTAGGRRPTATGSAIRPDSANARAPTRDRITATACPPWRPRDWRTTAQRDPSPARSRPGTSGQGDQKEQTTQALDSAEVTTGGIK